MGRRALTAATAATAVLAGAATERARAATPGEALYAEHCAACHGAALEGQPDWQRPNPDGTLPAPPHDASGHTWHHGDALLFSYVKHGGAATLEALGVGGIRSAMPAFGDTLSDRDIAAILDYIKSQWPPRIRDIQRERSAAEAATGSP